MMTEVSDLVWDYTGDDSSPLLQRSESPVCRFDDSCRLTYRQTQFILRSLNESTQIIRSARQHINTGGNGDVIHDVSDDTNAVSFRHRLQNSLWKAWHRFSPYFALVTVLLQVIAILTETIWDAASHSDSHSVRVPFVQIVLAPLAIMFVLAVYVDIAVNVIRNRLTFLMWLKSFIASLILFPGLYLAIKRYHAVVTSIYILEYLGEFQLSLSIFSLGGIFAQWGLDLWYTQTILSVQAFISYAHFVLIVSLIVRHISSPSSLVSAPHVTSGTGSTLRQLPYRDQDTDSLMYITVPPGAPSLYAPQSGAVMSSSGPRYNSIRRNETESVEQSNERSVATPDRLYDESLLPAASSTLLSCSI